DARLAVRRGHAAARADRQQLRRDDVDPHVRRGADGGGADAAGRRAAVQRGGAADVGAASNGERGVNRQRRRHLEQRVFTTIMRLSLFLALGVLGLILVTVVRKGLGALSWNMLTQSSTGGYYLGSDEGGILNAILGSLYLAAGATALALAAG